ncbi:ATP-binding protein [Deltaproteobacteria bacterium TL4]
MSKIWSRKKKILNEITGLETSENKTSADSEYALRRFHSIMDKASDAFMITEVRTGTIIEINKSACDLLGYTRKEILDLNSKELDVLNLRNPKLKTSVFSRLKSKQEINILPQCIQKRKDGSLFPVEVSISQKRFDRKDYRLIVFRDITARNEMEKELLIAKEQAEEMSWFKTNFLANMSHEIRTPLNAILGFAHLLQESMIQERYQAYIEPIIKNGQRLLKTINNIIELSSLESKQYELEPIELDLNEECHSIVHLMTPLAQEKKLSLSIVSKNSNVYAKLDRMAFSKILNYLVGNALKFTIEGEIRVEVDRTHEGSEDWAVIRIIDTGIGINTDFVSQIFEQFIQESSGYNRKYEGSGLGLSITAELIKLMNGHVKVESQPNVGSIFQVYFPAMEHIISYSATENKDLWRDFSYELPKNPLPRILLVENDSDCQELTKCFIESFCQLDIVSNGEEALEKAKSKQYEVVLLDINLGTGIDGREVTRQLRKMPDYQNTSIIALTAYAMKGDKKQFLKEGMNDYLSKPYSKQHLVLLIKRLLKERKKSLKNLDKSA